MASKPLTKCLVVSTAGPGCPSARPSAS